MPTANISQFTVFIGTNFKLCSSKLKQVMCIGKLHLVTYISDIRLVMSPDLHTHQSHALKI